MSDNIQVGDIVLRKHFPFGRHYLGSAHEVRKIEPHAIYFVGEETSYVPKNYEVKVRKCPVPVLPKLNDGARLPSSLPNESAPRKEYPLHEVLFGQFPAACVAIAHHSFKGNQKHNPGKPLQDNRALSNDDADCIMRHLMEGDYEGVAWRAMRLLQKKLEAEGAPVAPLATNVENNTNGK